MCDIRPNMPASTVDETAKTTAIARADNKILLFIKYSPFVFG
jgi:hypothetical protein